MARELFLVAQTGGVPTFIFQSMAQAEDVLRTEFWHDQDNVYLSSDVTWTGWSASGDEVPRLLGWIPERVVAA